MNFYRSFHELVTTLRTSGPNNSHLHENIDLNKELLLSKHLASLQYYIMLGISWYGSIFYCLSGRQTKLVGSQSSVFSPKVSFWNMR